MTNISLEIANSSHIKSFLELQQQNLLSNLPEEKLSSGFVTTPFTVEQLEQLIEQKSLFVALQNNQVIAYVVCASWQFLAQWPIFVHMVSLFDNFTYSGHKMTTENSYQYGPICIAHEFRGTGLLKNLFNFAKQNMASRYRYALTFVNKKNQRSYIAHTQKLGLDQICDFSFNNNEFYMMGFSTK